MEQINKKVVQFFSSLSDETRLKILLSLADGPKTVNGIYECVGKDKMTLSAVSHQLRQLRDIEIIVCERKGREKYVRLSDDFCWCILKDVLNHFKKEAMCKEYVKPIRRGKKK